MKKKILSVALAAVMMCLTCVGIFSAFATEAADYSENLVLHYDFKGATVEEALKDKSTVGEAANQSNLTPMANNTDAAQETDFTFDLTNGTVTKNSAGTAFLQTKTASGDFDCISEGKATMFLRYKMDPTLTAGANNGDRAWLADGKASSAHRFLTLTYYDGKLENILTSGNSTQHKTNGVINHTYAQDGAYSNYMVTYEKAEGGKILMTAYICMGDDFSENAWTLIGTKTTTGDDVMKPSDYADMTFRLLGSFFCDPTQKAGVTMDDMRIYNTVLTTKQLGNHLHETMIPRKLQNAYVADNAFAMFVDLTDERFVSIDEGGAWAVVGDGGAMGGNAIKCNTKANNVSGNGITVTFAVPADGNYTFWVRTLYPTQAANSLFYSVDGGSEYIWDFPDEDGAAVCYDKWQYFYMTERAAGTYTDTTLYGAWTIQNNQWRHKPHTVALTAGVHTIKITGREAGMLLDELVVTSLDTATYDPNAFTVEGASNTTMLETCKFCGTSVKHYISDIYAQKSVRANTYFAETLYPTASNWNDVYGLLKEDTGDTGDVTTAPEKETTAPEKETTAPEKETTAPEKETTAPAKDDATTAPETEATTNAPADDFEDGCNSMAAPICVLLIAAIGGGIAVTTKKKH